MSDDRPDLDPQNGSGAPDAGPSDVSRRASIQLDAGEGANTAQLMDPANESLAEALKITFRLVQLGMVILVLLFVFSGVQSVKEGERGVAVLFGKVTSSGDGLEPGFHFAAPYPFGELIKVDAGNSRLSVYDAFWPVRQSTRSETAPQTLDNLPKMPTLNPIRSGSLITADLNLAHAQWNATYVKDRVAQYIQNINPAKTGSEGDIEDKIVRAAIQRAVVHEVAETTIDELLRPTDARDLSNRVQRTAQQMLDDMGAGIDIQTVEVENKIPPARLLEAFESVQSARSEAEQQRSEARGERGRTLAAVAGQAWPLLVGGTGNQTAEAISGSGETGLIDTYEEAIELGDDDLAAATLAQIDAILIGDAVEIDGVLRDPQTAGEVTNLLSRAGSARDRTVADARSGLALYQAKLEQFDANPDLMIATDWIDAWSQFYAAPWAQVMRLPSGQRVELRLNEDPRAIEEAIREQQRQQVMDTFAARERTREENLEIQRRAMREGRNRARENDGN